MINLKTVPPRGVLSTTHDASRFRHLHVIPAESLRPFVEHFWIVVWESDDGVSHEVETLPHPSVHVTVETGHSGIGGVRHGRFVRQLEGYSRVFGIKFRPGGFYPFIQTPVSTLSDKVVPLTRYFADDGIAYEQRMLAAQTDDERVAVAESFLLARLPARDAEVEHITLLVERIIDDRTITRVEQLADECGLLVRTLQRRFTRYVGVSPKWVIQRYRLHDAIARVAEGQTVNWATLALRLGYFDQPHFIRDFKTLVERTPGEYAEHCQATLGGKEGDHACSSLPLQTTSGRDTDLAGHDRREAERWRRRAKLYGHLTDDR